VLKAAIEKYEKGFWSSVSSEVGMSSVGCKKRALEMGFIKKT
jgi:hypothetical protein